MIVPGESLGYNPICDSIPFVYSINQTPNMRLSHPITPIPTPYHASASPFPLSSLPSLH